MSATVGYSSMNGPRVGKLRVEAVLSPRRARPPTCRGRDRHPRPGRSSGGRGPCHQLRHRWPPPQRRGSVRRRLPRQRRARAPCPPHRSASARERDLPRWVKRSQPWPGPTRPPDRATRPDERSLRHLHRGSAGGAARTRARLRDPRSQHTLRPRRSRRGVRRPPAPGQAPHPGIDPEGEEHQVRERRGSHPPGRGRPQHRHREADLSHPRRRTPHLRATTRRSGTGPWRSGWRRPRRWCREPQAGRSPLRHIRRSRSRRHGQRIGDMIALPPKMQPPCGGPNPSIVARHGDCLLPFTNSDAPPQGC